jgi:hypothetical protein
MQEQRTERRRPRPIRSSVVRTVAALTATVLLLAACGGDTGASAPAGGYTLHTLIVNASAADAVIKYTGATPAPDITLPTCNAILQDFPLNDPFTIEIDGNMVLDSNVAAPGGLPNDGQSDLIVEVDIAQDGTTKHDTLRPGSGLTKPSKAAYCPSLP